MTSTGEVAEWRSATQPIMIMLTIDRSRQNGKAGKNPAEPRVKSSEACPGSYPGRFLDFEIRMGRFRQRWHFRNAGDATITKLMNRPDEARFVWIVAQCFSNLFDALDHGIVGDGCALPDIFNQLFFADQPLAPLEHVQEQMEGLLAKMLFEAASLEATPGGVDFDIFAAVDRPAVFAFPGKQPPVRRKAT